MTEYDLEQLRKAWGAGYAIGFKSRKLSSKDEKEIEREMLAQSKAVEATVKASLAAELGARLKPLQDKVVFYERLLPPDCWKRRRENRLSKTENEALDAIILAMRIKAAIVKIIISL